LSGAGRLPKDLDGSLSRLATKPWIFQVALRWLIERGALPIPGAKNAEQARHNTSALDFSLTPSEVEAIAQATLAWRQ
jgi:diketogulonate reductase-like aldo/keto reductase